MVDEAVIFFVRYPEPGRVKTRLARTLGTEVATKLYRELAEFNLNLLQPLREQEIEIIISFDPPTKEEEVKAWLRESDGYLPQCGGDLGPRISHAFQAIFQRGAKRVLILGSDTLGLTREGVREGFRLLETSQVVIGPARDGGYYLLGLQSLEPSLFQRIPWSGPHVFKTTLSRVKEQKLTYALLPELEDLDEIRGREEVAS